MENFKIDSFIRDMLFDADIESREMEVDPIIGGNNNKVFLVKTKNRKYLAKSYFSHSSDRRNRLATEFGFISYAWKIGLRCIPEPIFCYPKKNLGLYEFVEGRKLISSELTYDNIKEAIYFILSLNDRSARDQSLPIASEGCFSLERHFEIIDNSLNRLLILPIKSQLERQMSSFVQEIKGAWEKIKNEIFSKNESISRELDMVDRCISPSDFGFHNALLKKNGNICFIDFEYAGWDDPAKLVSDFFLQPEVPVPLKYFNDFSSEIFSYSKNKDKLVERAHLLFPAFKIKWCFIMLNEFLPSVAERRSFANPNLDLDNGKRLQLKKAQQFFYSRKV